MAEKNVSPYLFAFGIFVFIAMLFLILESSYRAQSGDVQGSVIIGNVASTLAFFFVGGIIILLAVKTRLIKSIKDSEVGLSNASVKDQSRDLLLGFLIFYLIGIWAPSQSIVDFGLLSGGGTVSGSSIGGGAAGTGGFLFSGNATEQTIITAQGEIKTVPVGVFAAGSAVLSGYWGNFLTNIASPIMEELFFFIAVPIILLVIIRDLLIKQFKLKFFDGIILQYLVVGLATGVIFALFHIGRSTLIAFFLSALVFRTILILLSSDQTLHWFKFATFSFVFAVGGHMANNIASTGGLERFISQLLPFNGLTLALEPLQIVASVLVLGTFTIALVLGVEKIIQQVLSKNFELL